MSEFNTAHNALVPSDGHWEIDGPKEFYRQDHGPLLLAELASLHGDSALTDVVLRTPCGSEFPCHRVILAASSPYFRAMFTNDMSESRTDNIDLPEISKSSLSTIIEYIYTGKLKVSNDTAQDLAEAAGFLQFLEVQNVCFKFLEAQLDVTNTREVQHVGDRLFSRQLSEHAKQFSAEMFLDIVASPEFCNYTKEEFVDLLSREIQVDKEEQVYEAIMRWVRRDVQERIAVLPELLDSVAFEVMPTSYLTDILGKETLLEDDPECAGVIARIRTITMKRDMHGEEQPKDIKVLQQPRNYSEVVVVFRNPDVNTAAPSSGDSVPTENPVFRSTILQYNPNSVHKKWEDLPRIPLKLIYEFPISAASYHNNVIVVTNKCRTFLYQSQHRSWSLLAQKYPPRNGSCLVATATDVYLMGGCSVSKAAPVKTVLKYESYVQQWKKASEMPFPMSHVTGVCCQGCVYAIGSKTASHFTSDILCFNPKTYAWKQCTPMPVKLMRTEAVAINGNIYVLGQRNDFTLDVCCYDTSTDTWGEIEGPLIARLGAATVVCNNKIYLIGGESLKRRLCGARRENH
ncbi:kelch-like protein 24 [Amphiura filiformis]|uniref:kelch-like protein 24 n=1 Tax=Amphiura filiformis TaxID=82378 RepID=UPI003B21EEFF